MPSPEVLVSGSSRPFEALRDAGGAGEGRYAVSPDPAPAQVLLLPGGANGRPLAAVVPLDEDLEGRLEALVRIWRGAQGRPVPPDTRLTLARRRRLRLMLQAADGRGHGASYREIAVALYGRERVGSTPWKTSSLRDAVIGLVEGSVAMIGGGYLQLLRHRRRS